MGLDTTINKVIAIGNGLTTEFSFPYLVQSANDLEVKVLKDDGITKYTLFNSIDFNVTGLGKQAGITLILVNDLQVWLEDGALRNGYKILIKRSPLFTQETDFKNAGAFYPEIHEDRFNRQTMLDQKLDEQLKRAVLFDEFSTTEGFVLPEPVANTFIGFDDTGEKLVTRPLDQSLVVADWPDILNKPATIVNIDTIVSGLDDDIIALESQQTVNTGAIATLEAETGVNLGSGEAVFESKTGGNLRFKTITQPLATTANETFITSTANNVVVTQPFLYAAISQPLDSDDANTYFQFLTQCLSAFGSTPINVGPQPSLAGRLKAYWIEKNDTYTYNGKTFISDRNGDYAILRRGVQTGDTFSDYNTNATWYGNNRLFNTVVRLPDSHRAAASSSIWGSDNWLLLPDSGGLYSLGGALESPTLMGSYLFSVLRIYENGIYKFDGFAQMFNQARVKYAIVYRSNLGGTWTNQVIGEGFNFTATTLQPKIDFDGSEIQIIDIGSGGRTYYSIQLAFRMETAGTSATTSNRHGAIPTNSEEFGTETATENFAAFQNYITNMQLRIQKML